MTILKKLVVAGRKYQDKSGKEKTVWKTVGQLHETNDGARQYITIDPSVNFAAFPRKEDDDRVYVNLFEPDEDKAGGGAAPQAARSSAAPAAAGGFADFSDDIPF